MTTLRDLVDDNYFGGSTIIVMTTNGARLGEIRPGEEEDAFAFGRFMGGAVVKEVPAPDGLYVYVDPPAPAPGAKGPAIYQGEIEDEAAWSANWRQRERKASVKQTSFIRKNIQLYRAIKKPGWPDDPKDLLSYEASDAMTVMLDIMHGD